MAAHIFSRRHLSRLAPLVLVTLLMSLNACSVRMPVHRIDIRQGNYLSDEQIENIQIGMSREEVQRILGSPVLRHSFHPNRWDYIYHYQSGKTGRIYQRGITLFFDDNGLVTSIQRQNPDGAREAIQAPLLAPADSAAPTSEQPTK